MKQPVEIVPALRSMTILVTGGTGQLGAVVTQRLLEEGHRLAVTWMVEKEAIY